MVFFFLVLGISESSVVFFFLVLGISESSVVFFLLESTFASSLVSSVFGVLLLFLLPTSFTCPAFLLPFSFSMLSFSWSPSFPIVSSSSAVSSFTSASLSLLVFCSVFFFLLALRDSFFSVSAVLGTLVVFAFAGVRLRVDFSFSDLVGTSSSSASRSSGPDSPLSSLVAACFLPRPLPLPLPRPRPLDLP